MINNTTITTVFVLIGLVGGLAVYADSAKPATAQVNPIAVREQVKYVPNVNEEARNEIVLEQLAFESTQKKESQPAAVQAKEETQPEAKQEAPVTSTVRQRSFRMNNGTYKSGQELIDYGLGNYNANKLWSAFNAKYGAEIADTALITLFYENGTFLETTTGVCNAKYQINGDYRNCVYADINSAGMDAGLKQINTYYQRYRIAKLGGPSCEPQNSRDITDPCTASQVKWLHNVDNNIAIALDIYAEQGFTPWYGYRKGFGV